MDVRNLPEEAPVAKASGRQDMEKTLVALAR